MKPQTTRTLNPLPFQDLEPHRFEDLVRQLAYDFRRWKRIESTGRGGADDGIDIRAIEEVSLEETSGDEIDDEAGTPPTKERVWIFQCKREREIGPKQLRTIVAESLRSLESSPDGFVIAASCDFSKKARDAFREEMVARGIGEFHLWGKADLEDMLVQPKNDPLLFIYFGLSLQPQRRSQRTQLRSLVATKKQIHSLFKEAYESPNHSYGNVILIRDPNDKCYPEDAKEGERPGWLLCRFLGTDRPEGFVVQRREHIAYVSNDGQWWDAVETVDFAEDSYKREVDNTAHRHFERVENHERENAREWWLRYVPNVQQAWLQIYRIIPWERVLAIDPHGDNHYPVPHIFVDFVGDTGPFLPDYLTILRPAGGEHNSVSFPRAREELRKAFFPVPIPTKIYPPPAEVVRSLVLPTPKLPKAAKEELDQVVKAIQARSTPKVPTGESPQYGAAALERRKEFCRWIDSVALPVFTSFVSELTKAGFQAWILPRERNSEDKQDPTSEVRIELQVRVPEPLPHNPDYYRSCHLIYTLTYGGAISIDRYPNSSVERPSIEHTKSGVATLAELTDERVRADLMGILKEISDKQFP